MLKPATVAAGLLATSLTLPWAAQARRGWTRNSLPVGTKVVVNAFQARDGARRGSPRDISFPDGRQLDMAGSYETSGKQEQSAPAPAK